ncbi:beta family protein [Chromobacterium haemolyticum]|uniref:beta family protein n=1 Tax=Chromobacterium haemolyticum TaxID=394935 RepID=UPI0009DCBE08|nr:beta family protein [Chromobacterium haemolyticum]
MIKLDQYVPILKWQQAEYQALMRSKPDVKNVLFPLFVIPPIGYDFEEKRAKKNINEHIEPIGNRIFTKWGKRKALLDIDSSLENLRMASGQSVIGYLFQDLRSKECEIIPVASLDRGYDFVEDISEIIKMDRRGLALRIKLDDLMQANINDRINAILKFLDVTPKNVDFILDLRRPEKFEPYDVFCKALVSAIRRVVAIKDFRSFVVSSLSLDMSSIKKPGGFVIRHEWIFYKKLIEYMSTIRIPTYSDYTIEYPEFIEQDMRLLNPAGKIIYSTDDSWLIPKGGAFRGGETQMKGHCEKIVKSGHYSGHEYSDGDSRIYKTAAGLDNNGNLGTWKQVGISHHFRKVVDQLANLHVL